VALGLGQPGAGKNISSTRIRAASIRTHWCAPSNSARGVFIADRVAELGAGSWWALNPAAALAVLTAADRALERDAQSFSGMSDAKETMATGCAPAPATPSPI